MSEYLNIWTGGGREDFSSIGGVKWLVLVFICLLRRLPLKVLFGVLLKSMVMLVWSVAVLLCLFPGSCRLFQRAEFCGAIVSMQAYLCHLGIDNLNVARSIGRLLDRDSMFKPLPLVKDGDLIALVQYMVRTRGRETVTGH